MEHNTGASNLLVQGNVPNITWPLKSDPGPPQALERGLDRADGHLSPGCNVQWLVAVVQDKNPVQRSSERHVNTEQLLIGFTCQIYVCILYTCTPIVPICQCIHVRYIHTHR